MGRQGEVHRQFFIGLTIFSNYEPRTCVVLAVVQLKIDYYHK